jgi:hypothetical protein
MKLKSLSQILSVCCLIFIGSCSNEITIFVKNEIVFKSLTEKNSPIQSQAVIFVSRNTNGKKYLVAFLIILCSLRQWIALKRIALISNLDHLTIQIHPLPFVRQAPHPLLSKQPKPIWLIQLGSMGEHIF